VMMQRAMNYGRKNHASAGPDSAFFLIKMGELGGWYVSTK